MPELPELHFLTVSDFHFQDQKCLPWLEQAFRQMRSHPADIAFCLVLGDLVEDGAPEQLRTMCGFLERLGVPAHVVIGNHDFTASGDRGPWESVVGVPANFRFEQAGRQFIGLDTTSGCAYQQTLIPESTFRWLDAELPGIDPEQPTLVFTHFPLAEGVKYRPRNALALLERFRDRNLQAVLSGHYHGWTETRWNGALLGTAPCCSWSRDNHDDSPAKGYVFCRARPEGITRRFVEVEL